MILVTGATGHIGNVLVRQLLSRGERVRALVRSRKTPIALAGMEVEMVPGDILDIDSLRNTLHDVEVVYHLAARISLLPGPDPEVERVNLEGTRLLIAAARSAGIRRLVYASSIYAMRPPPDGTPIDESCPFDPQARRGAYDQSKAAASLEVQKAAAQGLEAVIVCPTAVVGPYDFQNSDAGRGILYHMRPGIKFYIDGAYDFVDVRDVADGFIRAAQYGRPGATYILGGERLTVRQVTETVWETAGCPGLGVKVPLWLAYLAAEFMPLVAEWTGRVPLFTPYSLDALGSNSCIRHGRAGCELGYHPRPARLAIADAVRWFRSYEQPTACGEMQTTSAEAVTGRNFGA